MSLHISVQLLGGVPLEIIDNEQSTGLLGAAVLAETPDGLVGVCNNHFARAQAVVHTDNPQRPVLWLGSVAYHMPWAELLKVADFLVLPIPSEPAASADGALCAR